MTKLNISTSKKVEPKCYAYTTPDIPSKNGWTKIGYTEREVETRIREQIQTLAVRHITEWVEDAVFKNGKTFNDKAFHAYLVKDDIQQESYEYTDQEGNKHNELTEWFFISPQDSHERFIKFRDNMGIYESSSAMSYNLREEQYKAVNYANNYFRTNGESSEPEYLWNCKPRFGKTLSTYDLCKKLCAKKVLIVTNRPSIANSWYDDYVKFMGTESGYYFVSQVDELKGKKYVLSREVYINKHLSEPNHKGCIEFVSLQDLKGSIYFGGKHNKLKEIADLEWDILVIDEAHEGVDTYKTDIAFDQIKRKYTLHLTGTTFKALANNKFEEQAIFNWTYADEQKAKREWYKNSKNLGIENPYESLPQLNLYTYQMSEIVLAKARTGADFNNDGQNEEYAFDLNEFFATNSDGRFKHEEAVDKFLDALINQTRFPFSTPELRDELRHTFWLLNRVDSAKALAKKLRDHEVFGEYEVVLAAGNGRIDDDEENKRSLDRVKKAIAEHDKTITLSVGQLTTGITVPEWTAVLMLSNIESPALYMQAAFRAQNPCLFKINKDFYRKENAYVFDFDPARTLTIVEQFANNLSPDTSSGKGDITARKKHVYELLNFFPVYGEDEEGEMITLDAEKVLSIPRKIHSQEVVRRGFMSNFLFQNISNIFNAPTEIIDVIKQLEPTKEQVLVTPEIKENLAINDEGEVEVSQDIVIGQAQEVFGDKIYGLSQDLLDTVDEINQQKAGEPDEFAKYKAAFDTVTTSLVETAKESYGTEMSKSAQQAVSRAITSDANTALIKAYSAYQIENNKNELERNKEIAEASSKTEIAKINAKYDSQKNKIHKTFIDTVKGSVDTVVKNAGETIVKTVETEKRKKEKEGIEESVRAHLRGFSRTIPSFLMAYGDENTTLENFDQIIPDDVFQDVTSITLDQFRFLRDGGDYTDSETGETKHFEGHLFDPVVFNDSVKEFLNLKAKLANYFDESSKEDIFDYIPPQKTNQIFTPKKVVKEMVDYLEQENPGCFDNPDKTFIDLYMKSGMYITEIVKRLYQSKKLRKLFPDDKARLKHIFEKQVYGLAPTEIIYKISTAYILGFDSDITIKKHNFRQYDALPAAQNGTIETELDKVFE
ncbi:MAG: DEAD/DEAH box helicase family protein [Alphaproteobacteria bacterium]|nr:DEAD/DEAH box helicase family protein [Alphaproteobacteria bacterium]